MQNRSEPQGGGRQRGGGPRRPAYTVWVPPGTALITSPGVEVLTMGSGRPASSVGLLERGTEPRFAPGARAAGPSQTAQPAPRFPSKATPQGNWAGVGGPVPSGGWKLPERWADLAAGAWEKSEAEAAEMYVPPEVEAAAQVVMAKYEMKVSGMTLITTKPDKGGAIWRIETDKGPRSLKLLHRTPARSLFSIGAQDYLVRQGARVAPLVLTRDGSPYVVNEGRIWMVTDWIEGLAQATKVDLEGAAALCYGLGEFHRLSQGYVPPPGAQKASRLYRWPKTYQKIRNKIDWFRQIATAYAEMPASQTLFSLCDLFQQQAEDAIARLEASRYGDLVARGEPAWGIVHQDYGWSNGQIGPGGIWIIDLDGVAYDLPIRDLRKLITSTMDDMGVWDVTWMRGMIDAYNQANPIEPELYQVLLIDMSLPNEFYKHVKEGVTKNAARGNHTCILFLCTATISATILAV